VKGGGGEIDNRGKPTSKDKADVYERTGGLGQKKKGGVVEHGKKIALRQNPGQFVKKTEKKGGGGGEGQWGGGGAGEKRGRVSKSRNKE